MTKEIKIEIKPDGSLFVETAGYKGNACETQIDELMKEAESRGLKVEMKERKRKIEYYAAGQSTGTRNISRI